jgi:hypothetical protein
VNDKPNDIASQDALPSEAFRLTSIDLMKNERVTAEGISNCRGCRHLTRLVLFETNVGDADVAHFGECKKLTGLDVRRRSTRRCSSRCDSWSGSARA